MIETQAYHARTLYGRHLTDPIFLDDDFHVFNFTEICLKV